MKTPSLNRRSFLAKSILATGTLNLVTMAADSTNAKRTAGPTNGKEQHICATCGTQFPATQGPPERCPICLDPRQYLGLNGQEWTTLAAMRGGNWRNVLREQETNLVGIGTEPKFGIGQRALLVRTQQGNILWDCISFLDHETIEAVKKLGGISAIAISHPHYYSSMVEWSRAFDNAPIYLHEADRQWVQRPDPNIVFWKGETQSLGDGLTLINTKGHFDGFQVLHWRDGASGRGVILAGDQPQVAANRNWVSFMYSYPNFIPLNATAIRRLMTALEPFNYERLYGFSWPAIVDREAKIKVQRSAERYLKAIAG
jgi:hypothetical protein